MSRILRYLRNVFSIEGYFDDIEDTLSKAGVAYSYNFLGQKISCMIYVRLRRSQWFMTSPFRMRVPFTKRIYKQFLEIRLANGGISYYPYDGKENVIESFNRQRGERKYLDTYRDPGFAAK